MPHHQFVFEGDTFQVILHEPSFSRALIGKKPWSASPTGLLVST
jgi:hypothetical protein